MLNMSQVNDIKEMARMGYKVAQIAREKKISEKTVRKYLRQEDFSPRPPQITEKPSKLDPYKQTIEDWLLSDKDVWYKQRHTGKRVYSRLVDEFEGFTASYVTVQRFVRKLKSKIQEQKGFQELVWHPGEAQVDFGAADFIEANQQIRKKYLTVSFPYSR